MSSRGKPFTPSEFQLELNLKEFLVRRDDKKDDNNNKSPNKTSIEEMPLDVLFVGGGPAGLAGAIELSQMIKREGKNLDEIQIGVLEKAAQLGGHSLSGAVIHPSSLQELFPNLSLEDFPFRGGVVKEEKMYFLTRSLAFPLPSPSVMKSKGCYIASLSELVRWLGKKAEDLNVHVFTSFSASALLMEKGRVVGVRTKASGLDRKGEKTRQFNPPIDILAKITVLAEGSRGLLTQAYLKEKDISSPSPQIYSLGVKELWRTPRNLNKVIHTMNWPLAKFSFGGSFMYPMGKNLTALGIVVGLDSPYQDLDVHQCLQELKKHPLFKKQLEGGEIQEWGAKTIPEGGFYSLPNKLHGDGLLIIGDSAGLVNVPALKGIHYAIQSGMFAARAIFKALKEKTYSSEILKLYDEWLRESYVIEDLKKVRNMRMAFKKGLYRGLFKASLMTLTGGHFPREKILKHHSDANQIRTLRLDHLSHFNSLRDQGRIGRRVDRLNDLSNLSDLNSTKETNATKESKGMNYFSLKKSEAVYFSKNKTRDDVPLHLKLLTENLPDEVKEFYAHFCPAQVYEKEGRQFKVNAPNCIDCKVTDVLGPRWTPREGGTGPQYHLM